MAWINFEKAGKCHRLTILQTRRPLFDWFVEKCNVLLYEYNSSRLYKLNKIIIKKNTKFITKICLEK